MVLLKALTMIPALKQCSTYTSSMKTYQEPVAILSKEIITGVDTDSQPMELESEVSNT